MDRDAVDMAVNLDFECRPPGFSLVCEPSRSFLSS